MELLLIDIGRGTQDILLYRPGEPWENCIQMVLPAPTVLLAAAASRASAAGRDLFFTGVTMGGGPVTEALRGHLARGGRAWATAGAAATFDDDLEAVEAMGVSLVGDDEARGLSSRRGVAVLRTADVDLGALEGSLRSWGLPLELGAAAVAVQDHGRAPRGTSDRRFRFAAFGEMIGRGASLEDLSYTGEDLPASLTRMQGVRRSLDGVGPLLFMDTGFAALLGSLDDDAVSRGRTRLLLNAGNGHTLAGIVEGRRLAALAEHHTSRLDAAALEGLLDGLVDGTIRGEEVYGSGGHGACVLPGWDPPGWEGVDVFAATGPRRGLAGGLRRPPRMAAPHGHMMFTGNFGLYRAFESRWGAYEG